MSRFARLLAIVALVVFAAGTTAHAVGKTNMALAMSSAAMADSMDDCDGCLPAADGKTQACGQVCVAPFAAIPATTDVGLPFVTAGSATSPMEEIVGRTGPPDPYPPRTIILN